MPNIAATAEPESLLLDVKQVCRLLGIGRTAWYGMVAAGKTPAPVRLGRSVRWRRAELESWIRNGCPPRSLWDMMKKS